MKEQMERRRAELAAEHERGQTMLRQMQQEQQSLEQTLLRISGAIQILDELLTQPSAAEGEHGDNS